MIANADRPVFYLAALGLPADFTKVTAKDVTKAYRAIAGNGDHPDNGGNGERFALITAAYNELKAISGKKRGTLTRKSDEAWLRAWNALPNSAHAGTSTSKGEAKPEVAKRQPRTDGWVFEEREGESKEDRRKRYARERQAFRYANDPEFAAARKRQSRDSHQRKVQATKG